MRQQHRFKKHFRFSLALHVVVLFFSNHFSFAQTYPVSATLQLTPPYSVYLSDYTVNDQMKLHLLLRDLNEPSYQVRLSLVLEGVGIRIETNPNMVPPPIFIEGGIPSILSAEDLAPYLDTRNLIFSGISRQEYEQRAALPEGFYRLCFRVHDYKRKEVILSQEACAQAWFMLNDPPRINTPLCGTTLPVRDPQNILFQWLPMNANSPNSAFTTEYEFTLVEIRPPGRNPNDAINVGYPLFQTTTQQTSLIYGLLEPALIPGQEYAFRVRAIDTEGRDQFKNKGYSEVCTFKFGDSGVPPLEGMNVYVEGERRAKVTWFMSTETDRYRIEYRKKSIGTGYTWFTIETEQDNTLIQDLEPDTEYEVRVAGILRNRLGSYSPTRNFRTLPARSYSCGQPAESIITTNTNPLLHAMVGQIWKLDLFDMVVLEVSGGNGTFSGFGGVLVPFLGVKFYCQFENIKVNEKQELIAGEVLSVKGDVEALKKRLTEQNEKKKRDKAKSNGSSFEGVDIKFEGTIDSLYVNEAGEVIAVVAGSEGTSGGSSKKEERKIDTKKGADNRITDDSGNVYVVGKDGTIEKEGASLNNAVSAPDKPAEIDASNLDDFEKLVKEVIDTMYIERVKSRDSISSIKKQHLKEMDMNVKLVEDFEASVEDEEPTSEMEIDIESLMRQLPALDSIVESNHQKEKSMDKQLKALNESLKNIHTVSDSIKKSFDFNLILLCEEKKKRISNHVLQQLLLLK